MQYTVTYLDLERMSEVVEMLAQRKMLNVYLKILKGPVLWPLSGIYFSS